MFLYKNKTKNLINFFTYKKYTDYSIMVGVIKK